MANYLDTDQRDALARLARSWTWRTRWPTWLAIVVIYGGWFGTALHAAALGLPLATVLLIVFGAGYSSLQHELLHGHPTRWRRVNAIIGCAPLAVWFPYAIYRDSHLQHHDDPHLTHPGADPESWFVTANTWRRASPLVRALLMARNTLAGRVLTGPAWSIAATAASAVRKIARGDYRDVPAWLAHAAALAMLASWLDRRCAIPPWLFVFVIGYGSLALAAVRAFREHRPHHAHEQRSAINEAGLFWRLLFLNNNYHAVHHALPFVPWFALRAVYLDRRDDYLARNGGFLVKGYGEWFRHHAWTPVAHAVHPGVRPFPDPAQTQTLSFGAPPAPALLHERLPAPSVHGPAPAANDTPARLAG